MATIRHRPQILVTRIDEQVLIDHGTQPHGGKFWYARSDLYKQTYSGLAESQVICAELDPITMFDDGFQGTSAYRLVALERRRPAICLPKSCFIPDQPRCDLTHLESKWLVGSNQSYKSF